MLHKKSRKEMTWGAEDVGFEKHLTRMKKTDMDRAEARERETIGNSVGA